MHPTDRVAIGCDIGPMPGIVGLRYSIEGYGPLVQPAVVQCTSTVCLLCLTAIIPTNCALVVIFYERYVVSGRSAKVKHAAANAVTRNLAGQIETLASDRIKVIPQNASDVMNWALDERLDKSGLLLMTKGMQHARSAARHAIYGAKKTLMVPDPLSRHPKAMPIKAQATA
jgi:hypothetical protein